MTEDIKHVRYVVSGLANLFIALFFIFPFYRLLEIGETTFAIGLPILGIAFAIKAFADLLYAFFPRPKVRHYFHLYTALHYLLAGIVLLAFRYFGYFYSILFGGLAILFAVLEFQHYKKLEDEVHRIRRHVVSMLFKILFGTYVFFDAIFYNVIKPTAFGWAVTILGSFMGFYILFSAIRIYEYVEKTSKITIKRAFFPVK